MSTPPGRTHRYFTAAPLYPFGFGLSYAVFLYSGLSAPPSLARGAAAFEVGCDLAHAGGAVSDEVVQLYGAFRGTWAALPSVPRQQLLNFTRLHALGPNAARRIVLSVRRDALALMGPDGVMRVAAGTWRLWMGGGPPGAERLGGSAVLSTTIDVQ